VGATHPAGGGEWLRSEEVARRLKISKRRVQMLFRDGLLPGLRVGRVWRVPRAAFESYLEKLAQSAEKNLRGNPCSISEPERTRNSAH